MFVCVCPLNVEHIVESNMYLYTYVSRISIWFKVLKLGFQLTVCNLFVVYISLPHTCLTLLISIVLLLCGSEGYNRFLSVYIKK